MGKVCYHSTATDVHPGHPTEAWDDVPQRFTQIVFDQSQNHWVCVSNNFTDGIVEIHDSVPTKTLAVSKSVMRQVATVLKT